MSALIPPLTPAQILARLLTVDGSGSGLDADLLRATTPTATGLALVGAADAAAGRTALALGTIATQNANSVAITGGAIDGTPIGGSTPDAIAGTTGTFSGVLGTTANGSAAAPSLRVGAEQHGFYRDSAASIICAIAGADALRATLQPGTASIVELVPAGASGAMFRPRGTDASLLTLGGSWSTANGARILIHGHSHATTPNRISVATAVGTGAFVERAYWTDAGVFHQVSTAAPGASAATEVRQSNGILDVGTSVRYRGTKLLGAQGAAVADSDNDPDNLRDRLNELIARCRSHGLIAT